MVDAAAGLNIIDEKRNAQDVIEMSCRKQKALRPGRDVVDCKCQVKSLASTVASWVLQEKNKHLQTLKRSCQML